MIIFERKLLLLIATIFTLIGLSSCSSRHNSPPLPKYTYIKIDPVEAFKPDRSGFNSTSLSKPASEFVGRSEKAAIGTMGILSVYSSKCGDLTSFGNDIYLKIASAQEAKGRLIYDMKEFRDAVSRMNAFIKKDGLSKTCDVIYKIVKLTPILNKSL
jgi:hypothetical protein